MRNYTYLKFLGVLAICTTGMIACKNDPGVAPSTVRRWDILEAKSIFEIPAPAGKNEEAEVTIVLLSDNSLEYNFHIHNLTPGDVLTGAHIHFGDAGSSGPVFIDLNPKIIGSGGSGVVKNLRPGQVDSLTNKTAYFNAHSSQAPGGIVRVQLDTKVEFAMDIPMSGINEVPAVTTTATGTCILRLTEDKKLYSKISVTGIESDDTLRVAHLHKAPAGSNGPVRIFLANNIDDFGVLKITPLVDSLYNMVKADPMYANAHSKLRGSGLVRGQLR